MGIFSRVNEIPERIKEKLHQGFKQLEESYKSISQYLDTINTECVVVSPHAFRDRLSLDDLFDRASACIYMLDNLINTQIRDFRDEKLFTPYSERLTKEVKEMNFLKARLDKLVFLPIDEADIYDSLTLEQLLEKGVTPQNLLLLSYDNFISGIEKLPHQIVKSAYAHIMYTFFIDTRHDSFVARKFNTSIADDLHNLPLKLGTDLEGFEPQYFWGSIFNYKLKKVYILGAFLRSIKTYLTLVKKQGV